jgi:heterodisulfide reductase subunit A
VKTTVYFCTCGGNIAEKIDPADVERQVAARQAGARFVPVQFLCAEEGLALLDRDLREQGIERVVVAACSPREHEGTFRRALAGAGVNPYLLQMVNVREQVAWVTDDPGAAAAKAARLVDAALRRVALQEPLPRRQIEICADALVIGAGPAGLKAALTLAAAGRQVTLVEKSAALGGLPVRYEELFPDLECGSCLLEPLLMDVLHGEHAQRIEVLTLAEVVGVVGSYGNFTVKIRQRPRYVNSRLCIGCGECVAPCPVTSPSEFDCGLGARAAIAIAYPGALPNLPAIDAGRCLRLGGGDCDRCRQACPVAGVIDFDERERVLERAAGAIVVAVGAGQLDCASLPNLGAGRVPDVHTAAAFERLLAANGPTGGELRTAAGAPPRSVGIVHCVGSLEAGARDYCSGICCQVAFKFSHLVGKKLPGARRHHFFKEIAATGKNGFVLARRALADPDTTLTRYREDADLDVRSEGGAVVIRCRDAAGGTTETAVDLAVLCPAVVPGGDAAALGAALDIGRDRFGFFEERHARIDAVQSGITGILIAGACQAPMDVREAVSQGLAAAGQALAGLVPGRTLELEPATAAVDAQRCSGCAVCVGVCPYTAISLAPDEKTARVNEVLCLGCGTCAAACPAGAIQARHFGGGAILAEIAGLLA